MSESELDGTSFNGEISEYGGGGYTQELPNSHSESLEVIQYLKDNLWIDRATRAVFIDFTVYNANINLFCVVRYITRIDSLWTLEVHVLARFVRSSVGLSDCRRDC